MPEIKRVTLHPLKKDGTIDTDINLYPKTLIDGVVDREGEQVEIQEKLVSGQTIKTVNDEDILGEGNIEIDTDSAHWGKISGDINDQADLAEKLSNIEEDISSKQDVLVSGESIKTLNGESLLGSGNIEISQKAIWGSIEGDIEDQTDLGNKLNKKSSIAGPFTPVWATQDFHFSLKPADKENIFNNAYDGIRILLNNAITNATLINNTQTAKYYTITTPYGEEDLPTIYLYTIIKSGLEYVDSVDSVKLPNSNLASISDLLTPEAFDITNNVIRFNTNDVSKIISSKYDTLLVNNNGETVSFRLVTNESYSAAGLNIEEVLYTTTLWISDFEVVNVNLSLIKKVNPQSATVEYEQTLVKTSVNADGMPKCFAVDNIQEQTAKEEVILNDYKFIFTNEKLYELNKSQTQIISGKTLVTKLYTNFNGSADSPVWEVMTFVKDGDESTSLTISNVQLNIPVEDVKVNGSSVVVNKVAQITVPTKVSDLDNDSQFVDEEALANETLARQNADTNLQEQIDAITVSSDVVDIVGTYQELLNYDTSKLAPNSVIKVLQDSTHSNAMSYYRWTLSTWIYIGSEGPFYTKSESDNKYQEKLISGTNIKTIDGTTLLGSGNINTKEKYTVNILVDMETGKATMSQEDIDYLYNVKPSDCYVVSPNPTSGTVTQIYELVGYIEFGSETNLVYKTLDFDGTYLNSTLVVIPKSASTAIEPINQRLAQRSDIPTKTSDLTNDSGFITEDYHDSTKQDTLVSGTNIKTINNQDILGSGNVDIEGGYPEVPEDAYSLYDLIEIYSDETTIPDGIYTVTQDWFIDVPKQDGSLSDSIFANSLLYINRGNSIIGWSGPSSSTYWYNGDGTFFGGVLNTTDDVDYAIDEKLGNVVTTDTDQDITGIKTIRATDGLKFRFGSEATRTVIKPISGGMAVAYTDAQGVTDNNFEFSQGYNTSNKTLIPKDTATQDLGKSDRVWNILYVSKLNDGTNEKSFSSLLTNNSSLIPTYSSVYTLGDNTHRWYYLYMSGNIEMQLGDIKQVKSITANEYKIKDGNYNDNSYSILKYAYVSPGKTVAQLQNGLDLNNRAIINLSTPEDNTSPISKGYADNRYLQLIENVANAYDSTLTYNVGDIVTYQGLIYKCIEQITTAEDFDSTKWQQIKVTDLAGSSSNYVDLTSDQTIAGVKSFSRNILPSANGTINLGSSSSKWQHLYLGGSIIWGSSYIQQQGTSIVINPSGNAVVANADDTKDLGADGRRWRNIYLSGNLSDDTNETSVEKINNNFAPIYDATATYAVGDFVIYQGALYKCSTAIETAEVWDSTHWTAANVADNLGGSAPSNMMTTDTAQTISGEKTISNAVALKFAGTYTGQIVNQENQLRFKYGGSDKLKISTANITSSSHLIPNSGNTYDLGTSTYKWREVYVGGNLSDGTNAVSVAHLAQNTPTQWYGTQAEYDALGTYDSDTIYNIIEG